MGLSVAVLLASAMVLSLAPAMLTVFGRAAPSGGQPSFTAVPEALIISMLLPTVS